ncbi:sigma-70 family RNA polymerase sigma factor [Salibacter sp.]|uniref:RNA polymerase sigma factor n=1 Tax=Salibacter sp. TaxID=2010995 RepID=UPI00286FB716|nr:sigma-70 family RNA polymerase sigma factor [Salibacter sp.]MDR9399144.1 sigma-70 family RNA polymerase sigma factor [Salibacter sp.]MDR9488102.1 sigma-70 family RNA polymerase sigma factor [Salibacter sp.]
MEKKDVKHLNTKARADWELIQKAKDGDEMAYDQLMSKYYHHVYMEVLTRVKRDEVARDLAIEALTKAFTQLHTYEPRFAFSTWLKRVTVNHTIDYLRKKQLNTTSIDEVIKNEDGEMSIQIESSALTPQQQFEKSQRIDIVRSYVSKLKDAYRSLIELRYFNELSYEEIAQQLGIPLGTVKARLHRAKGMLNQMMVGSRHTI